MRKLHLFVAGLALTISALAASNASGAAHYSTNSVPAFSSVPVAEVVPVTQNFVLTATGAAEISCSTVRLVGAAFVNETNKATATSIHFSNCTDVTEPTKKYQATRWDSAHHYYLEKQWD
jgi:type 1 fimbria pilin